MPMSRRLQCAASVLMLLLVGAGTEESGPHYTVEGSLALPTAYREWVFLTPVST